MMNTKKVPTFASWLERMRYILSHLDFDINKISEAFDELMHEYKKLSKKEKKTNKREKKKGRIS